MYLCTKLYSSTVLIRFVTKRIIMDFHKFKVVKTILDICNQKIE